MKKFNVNHAIYVQITKAGFEHLKKTVGEDYIKDCITPYQKEINGEVWYKLQAHNVFDLLPIVYSGEPNYHAEIMFEDDVLEDVLINKK